jgi:hypothetical protein
MAWAMVAGAAVSVIGGSLMSNGSSSGASGGSERLANSQAQIGEEQWNRYKQIYAPMEEKYVNEAQNYDSPEAYAKAAGEAQATTSEQFGKARERLGRTPGLDPSSGAYTAAMSGLDLSQAAVDATGQNAARNKVKDTAWARKTDAISLGKGLPAQASATMGAASMGLGNIGAQQAAQSNAQGAQWGRIASAGVNAFNNSSLGLNNAKQQGYTEFSNNYTPENYG